MASPASTQLFDSQPQSTSLSFPTHNPPQSSSDTSALLQRSPVFPPPPHTPSVAPLFHGYVKTVADALILVQGALNGQVGRLTQKPTELDRNGLIESGTVIIFDERETGIKRWTDARTWSETRSVGQFLLYRETTDIRPLNPPKHSSEETYGGSKFGHVSCVKLRALMGALPDHRKCRGLGWVMPEGLIKRTITVPVGTNKRFHVVSYYYLTDVLEHRLKTPTQTTNLNITIHDLSPEVLNPKCYRKSHLKVKQDGNGVYRYAGESQIDDYEREREAALAEGLESEDDEMITVPIPSRHIRSSSAKRYAPYERADRRSSLGKYGLGLRVPEVPPNVEPKLPSKPSYQLSPVHPLPTANHVTSPNRSMDVCRSDSQNSHASGSSNTSSAMGDMAHPFDNSYHPVDLGVQVIKHESPGAHGSMASGEVCESPLVENPVYYHVPLREVSYQHNGIAGDWSHQCETPSLQDDGNWSDASPQCSQSDYSPSVYIPLLPHKHSNDSSSVSYNSTRHESAASYGLNTRDVAYHSRLTKPSHDVLPTLESDVSYNRSVLPFVGSMGSAPGYHQYSQSDFSPCNTAYSSLRGALGEGSQPLASTSDHQWVGSAMPVECSSPARTGHGMVTTRDAIASLMCSPATYVKREELAYSLPQTGTYTPWSPANEVHVANISPQYSGYPDYHHGQV